MSSIAREVSRSIATPSKSKEIFQDENCINYSNCLKEYLDRLLLGLTDKVQDGTLTYKQGVEIMYNWDDAVYAEEIDDFQRREPNIHLLHKYTFLRFFQYLGNKSIGVTVPFAEFLPIFIRACARRPEIPEEYFKMDLMNRKVLVGDILRKCLRSSSRIEDASEVVQKVDDDKKEVTLVRSHAPKSYAASRRSFKVPSSHSRKSRREKKDSQPLEPKDSVSVAPPKSVLSRRTESDITKSVMEMFQRSTT